MAGFKVDTSAFQKSVDTIAKRVHTNTVLYARTLGVEFVKKASRGARWIDRTGNARRGFDAKVEDGKTSATMTLIGSAKNYKRGKNSALDYMEYLEFDNNGAYAIFYDTVREIRQEITRSFGSNAFVQSGYVNIQRDAEAHRVRQRRSYRKGRERQGLSYRPRKRY